MTDERCIQGLGRVPAELRGCVLTIGNFDGVHVGHRRIVALAGELAGGRAPVVALTFEPPPNLLLRPGDVPRRLTLPDEKCRLLLAAGAGWVVTAETTAELLSLTADDFIARVALERFAPRAIVEGPDFFFGRGRAGSVETLRAAGAKAGFEVRLAEPVTIDLPAEGRQAVSSTLVRRLLLEGRVDAAARCLGRPYAMSGRVVAGRRVGRLLEYPTANLEPGEQLVPADGVYAGWATMGREVHAAAVSIGSKPTFDGGGQRAVEAFLLGGSGDYYGRRLTIAFARRLRDQERFPGAEALKAQIARDVESVRGICR